MRTLATSALIASLAILLDSSAVHAQSAPPIYAPPAQPIYAPPPPVWTPPPPSSIEEPEPPLPLTMQIPPPLPPPPPPVAPPLPPPPIFQAPPKPASSLSWAVPKAFSLTAGWSYTPVNTLPVSTMASVVTPQGVNVDTGFFWQVRGFDGVHWPVWIGVMGSFVYYTGQPGVADTYGLAYGLYIKHAVFTGRRARLFFGYGLGATQLWIRDLDGRGAGSYTRLSVGIDTHITRSVHATVEFSYRFFNMPTFKLGDSGTTGYDLNALSILGGFWFGR